MSHPLLWSGLWLSHGGRPPRLTDRIAFPSLGCCQIDPDHERTSIRGCEPARAQHSRTLAAEAIYELKIDTDAISSRILHTRVLLLGYKRRWHRLRHCAVLGQAGRRDAATGGADYPRRRHPVSTGREAR